MQDFLSLHEKKNKTTTESFNFHGTEKMHGSLERWGDVQGESLAERRGWLRRSPVLCPPGSLFIVVLLFDLVESRPRAKLLIASGERATCFRLHFQSLQPITSYLDDAKNQLLEKYLMRSTNKPLFFHFPSRAPVSLRSLLILFLLLFLYIADCCHNFPLELSLHAPYEK